ncbi:uncharacterized protein TA17320 [Theileria annulata]|uniref:Uncharacterized protein n=1 Tax=Theileria annulata TaxID=5874 RepID=Q4UAN3_THEAN|nr:uncharacterized protein TA17320 [Theileria annulata]CAI76118.1 hypothetical protein TA17320 [Theileria annulata]|eukprot:XP_952744.1 hypothetical protein TA17320 [Theileria annulata]
MDLYRVDEDYVKPSGRRFNLNFNEKKGNKKMFRIQIERDISDQIGPKGLIRYFMYSCPSKNYHSYYMTNYVLDSLRNLDEFLEEQAVSIKGKEYTIVFLKDKRDLFLLGNKPNKSINITDNFFGTIHVSQKISSTIDNFQVL